MRTLIYALALQGHGTRRLARALTRDPNNPACGIGLFGGHEIIGQGGYGSCADVPDHLVNELYNPDGYGIGAPGSAGVGDNRLAELYFEWLPYRGAPTAARVPIPPVVMRAGAGTLMSAMQSYLYHDSEEGFFVDISQRLAAFYPILDILLPERARAVHLVKDGREWVQKQMHWNAFSPRSGCYGSVHCPLTTYPHAPLEWFGMSRFEKCCRFWAGMHVWFRESGRPVFRVEDFNKPEIAERILAVLYPEATGTERARFILRQDEYGESGYKPHPEWEKLSAGAQPFPPYAEWSAARKKLFETVCGEEMTALGY